MIDWLAMGGYGAFVWGSYAVSAAALAIELASLIRRRRRALARARAEAQERAA